MNEAIWLPAHDSYSGDVGFWQYQHRSWVVAKTRETLLSYQIPPTSSVSSFLAFWRRICMRFNNKETEKDANPPFDADTPLSALFRENHHGELRQIIDSWRPYLIDDDPTVDALALTRFEFDFGKVIATHIYIDLGRLLYVHALKDDNMRQLASYLYQHSNLSNSESTLYVQLRKYKKR